MEVLTVITAALAFASGEAAKTVVAESVKDAYRAMKEFLSRKYPEVDLTPVEKVPESKARQAVLVEDLTNSSAAADPDFSPLAKRLVDAVATEMRKSGAVTGVQLDDFEAASLRIDDVIATGTGVLIKKARIAGPAEFTRVRGRKVKAQKNRDGGRGRRGRRHSRSRLGRRRHYHSNGWGCRSSPAVSAVAGAA